MGPITNLSCRCGLVRLRARGRPLIVTECHCNSCREAAARLLALPGSPQLTAPNGGTPSALYRKDRVDFVEGAEQLKAFRLKPDSKTRRVVATCCNTPVFLEFQAGHWIDLFSPLWPEGDMPTVEARTMTSDLPNPSVLDESTPSGPLITARFYAKLLIAWAAMGFRTPEIDVGGELNSYTGDALLARPNRQE